VGRAVGMLALVDAIGDEGIVAHANKGQAMSALAYR
jgi:hypothetical protein